MAKSCFVISVIGEDQSDERKHADLLKDHIVSPVVTALGFDKPTRADNIAVPGMITNQIVSAILDSDLVIADLSYENGNVFYELAIRHAAQKPVIHIAINDAKLPFDNAQARTIFFGTQVDEADTAKSDLKKAIEAVEKSSDPTDNPIGKALQIGRVAGSKDIHAESLAALLEGQADLLNSTGGMTRQLRELTNLLKSTNPHAINDTIYSDPNLGGALSRFHPLGGALSRPHPLANKTEYENTLLKLGLLGRRLEEKQRREGLSESSSAESASSELSDDDDKAPDKN